MRFTTLSLALLADGETDAVPAIRCAQQWAQRSGAHLNAIVVVPPFLSPATGDLAYFASSETFAMIEAQNAAHKGEAEATATLIRSECERTGVVATVEIVLADREPTWPRLLRLARLSEVCVLAAPGDPLARDLASDLLFAAGAPILFAPPHTADFGAARKIAIAWDGGAAAARAVREARPLLAEAESVDILCVQGERDPGPEASGADLAQALARICRDVNLTPIKLDGAGVGFKLREHARRGGADLLVMGAYGHSRLREFVLGGATRDMLAHIELPTFMSH